MSDKPDPKAEAREWATTAVAYLDTPGKRAQLRGYRIESLAEAVLPLFERAAQAEQRIAAYARIAEKRALKAEQHAEKLASAHEEIVALGTAIAGSVRPLSHGDKLVAYAKADSIARAALSDWYKNGGKP